MNLKKIFLLIMILLLASAIYISPGFATTKTTEKIYFDTKNEGDPVVKKIGSESQDQIELRYNVEWMDMPPKIQTYVGIGEFNGDWTIYRIKSAKVTFIKKVGSKSYYSTKTFKDYVEYNAKNGYKPYYVKVTYTDIDTTGKIYFNTKKDGTSVSKKINYCNKFQLQYNIIPSSNSKKIQTHIITKQDTEYTTQHKTAIIKIINAKVNYAKKVGSKNYYITKTLKPKNGKISYNAKNGYKPYYAKITYQWFYSKLK